MHGIYSLRLAGIPSLFYRPFTLLFRGLSKMVLMCTCYLTNNLLFTPNYTICPCDSTEGDCQGFFPSVLAQTESMHQ